MRFLAPSPVCRYVMMARWTMSYIYESYDQELFYDKDATRFSDKEHGRGFLTFTKDSLKKIPWYHIFQALQSSSFVQGVESFRFQFGGLMFDFRILTFHPTDIWDVCVDVQTSNPEQHLFLLKYPKFANFDTSSCKFGHSVQIKNLDTRWYSLHYLHYLTVHVGWRHLYHLQIHPSDKT